jgi:hypothetical protein
MVFEALYLDQTLICTVGSLGWPYGYAGTVRDRNGSHDPCDSHDQAVEWSLEFDAELGIQ